MGQGFDWVSTALGVSSPRHKSFSETVTIFGGGAKSCATTAIGLTDETSWEVEATYRKRLQDYRGFDKRQLTAIGQPEDDKKKTPQKKKPESQSDSLFHIYAENVDHSKDKTWLGPSTPDTKTALSPASDQFKLPADMSKLAHPDNSHYDTLLMTPGRESQTFQLRQAEEQNKTKYENVPLARNDSLSLSFWGPLQPAPVSKLLEKKTPTGKKE